MYLKYFAVKDFVQSGSFQLKLDVKIFNEVFQVVSFKNMNYSVVVGDLKPGVTIRFVMQLLESSLYRRWKKNDSFEIVRKIHFS